MSIGSNYMVQLKVLNFSTNINLVLAVTGVEQSYKLETIQDVKHVVQVHVAAGLEKWRAAFEGVNSDRNIELQKQFLLLLIGPTS